MEPDEIKSLLLQHFDAADIEVAVEGSHVNIMIVSDEFDGLNTLKRQQKVYAALSAQIAGGTIHAVNMKTLTQAEHQA